MSKGEKNAMATNIQKYLAFLKTVEYGSFTRAGELLGYTQSNISHMVNDLETEWQGVIAGAEAQRRQPDL